MAYVLVCALRQIALRHTQFAQATCGTIRLKLFKIGALEVRPTRRWSGMDSNFRFRARMATVPSLRALSISLKLFGFRRRTCRPQGPKFRIHFRSSSESSELRSRDRRPERRDLGFGADRGHVARWPARRRLLDWAIRAG